MTPRTEKLSFESQLQTIAKLHRNGASGVLVALAISKTLNVLLRLVFDSSRLHGHKGITLVALGGYGRKELNFASDVDIMILANDEGVKTSAATKVHDFLHRLLDHGLDIGHSVRTIDECMEVSTSELEVWISLLEARFLVGDRTTFLRFEKTLHRHDASNKPRFLELLLSAVQTRHDKYGHSAKLLEPNIKNSAGGLRDLHSALWILRGTNTLTLKQLAKNQTATTTMLRAGKVRSLVHTDLVQQALKALDFLLRVRNEMHLQAKNLHDTLEFSFQRQIAEALAYRSATTATSVERFMRDYYIAARSVAQFARRISAWAEDKFLKSSKDRSTRSVNKFFSIRSGKLDLRGNGRPISNDVLLLGYLTSIGQNIPFSHQLEDRIERRLLRLWRIRTESETKSFRMLLSSPSGVSGALQHMNDLGLLEQWIPEWKPLVAFFQHNIYHYYTADEHTLRVVANAEQLASAETSFGEVFRSLPRRDTLYLACLFHDIAKPKRIGDHEVIGVEMTRTILKRLRFTDVMDDVLFLVRNHLLMEQVAFRRNLNDPKTIVDFASQFSSPTQLDYLYVLTYADLSAVNKNVWTDWKEMLLSNLYRKAREVITHRLTEDELRAFNRKHHRESIESLASSLAPEVSHDEALRHLEAMENEEYLTAFSKAEIAEHLRVIRRQGLVSTIFRNEGDHTTVTIIAKDAPFALSRFCGVLSANDANIFDANIFTRSDGMIIDKFRVSDFISKSALTSEQCQKIQQELLDVFRGAVEIEDVLSRHKMKWKRRTQSKNLNVRVDVEFEEHPEYCIIDVFAPDTLGFLYRITKVMSELGLNITFAKIATRVDGIVDSFYVLDRDGTKIESHERRTHIRRELLKCIEEVTSSELAPFQ